MFLVVSVHPATGLSYGALGVSRAARGLVNWSCAILSAERAALGGHGTRAWSASPAPPPSLLGKTHVRLHHGLNLQRSALTLISHFLPSSDGTDQIKPCRHRGLTGGLALCREHGECPCMTTVEAWQSRVSREFLLGDCRLWPFKAGSITGEGHVGSIRANQCPLPSPTGF